MKKKISRILGVGVTLAVVTTLLVGALPAAALSGVTTTLVAGTNIISGEGDYTVTFTVAQELVAGDTITITLPSDTGVAGVTGASISCSPGWITNPVPPPTLIWGGGVGAGGFTFSAAARTITYTLAGADNIGNTANVIINVPVDATPASNIVNPSTPGDYTLTVRTSQETTAVTSNAYSIVAPSLYYPGTVELWNPGGYLMNVGNSINTAIGLAAATGNYTIKVGTGYYDEVVVVDRPVAIVAMEGASPVIADLPATAGPVGGTLTVQNTADKTATNGGVTLDGLTIMGNLAGPGVLTVGAEGVTVQNCTFTKYGTTTTAASQTMVAFTAASPTYASTISNCSFDMTLGSVDDLGVNVTGNYLTVSGCDFTGDGNAVTYTQDYYIKNAGGTALMPTVSYGNTATGTYSGTHIYTTGGVMVSSGDSMSGLWRAIRVFAGSLTIRDATITSCGLPVSATLPTGVAAVDIWDALAASQVTMTNSTVSNSLASAIGLQAVAPANYGGTINMMFNEFTGNANNIYTARNAVALGPPAAVLPNLSHNWWGDPAGPAADTITQANPLTDLVDTSYPLGAPATGAFTTAVPATGFYSFTTQGVSFTASTIGGVPVQPNMLGAANYASNPAGVDTPEPVIEDGYYEVFIDSTAPVVPTDVVLVVISNPNIDETTVVYVLDELNGIWGLADVQGTNIYGHTVWFQTGLTIWPPVGAMCGTPVALATAPLGSPAQSSLVPAQATEDVDISVINFSWGAVTGAEGYEFELSEYPFSPDDLLVEETADTNGLALTEDLDNLTVYAWRVRAYRGEEYGPWVTSFFTTEAYVAPPEPDTWVIEQEPTQIEWPEDITVVVPPIETTEIPEYILWVIVAVGAILVIAVVVLIVRTRRVA